MTRENLIKTDELKSLKNKETHIKLLYSIYFLFVSLILIILQIAWAFGFFLGFVLSELITFTGVKVFKKDNVFINRDKSIETMFLGFIIVGLSIILMYFNGNIGANITLFGIGISVFAYAVFYRLILRLSNVRIIMYEALSE